MSKTSKTLKYAKKWENMISTRKEEEVGMRTLATEVPVRANGSELTKKALGEIVQFLNCLPFKYENLSFDPKHPSKSCAGEWKREDLWSLLASQSN